ncbi:MAG: hypothetical protein RID53_16280 [Coleofasciculus sp. B1-GNL1-01]|uniref:NACHT domain-containing protein n=1 Tax=Coleofasciculus sp. B1-GNL1-01 TaxID=3068484 RepID=UPI0033020CD0
MNYPFENLDPEKIQEFCQSLLIKEFPDVQCFPVAQPDGGRDALAYLGGDRYPNDFIMFQVKFNRRPQAEKDPHKWLVKILEGEAPKLKKQIAKGAKRFVLMTNVAGTAHPDSGSLDKVNNLLNNEFGVPSFCWWRDDLSRRLDDAWNLKWAYPELMTGADLIRSVIESSLSENKERRTSAIRAFVKDQFLTDQVVRFKQVDLQNRLLDLFIDVPITPPHSATTREQRYRYHHIHQYVTYITRSQQGTGIVDREDINSLPDINRRFYLGREEKDTLGAATLLLHPIMQEKVPWIVLEGAPGQGKSTITQYLCQVHRMRVLGDDEVLRTLPEDHKDEVLETLPESHRSSPVRLPFKVDLRDLAAWLAGKNPFSLENGNEPPPDWRKSLETFLAAQVRHCSGGSEFSVDDLRAVARLSPLLLVFDGLDEVADIGRRQEVVKEIVSGVNRLEAVSLQVVVTSRPAAFANSPGLPEDKFPYYQLDAVTPPLITEYAEKWLKARKLQDRESADVKKILREKLDQPHLRDLARNPMQLTILLSLIHTRGSSLPDKRTALYDSYVELFFNRESEKSAVVREHRDLLIDIHRYLAWILHAEAEQEGGSGSITEDKLHKLLSEYLATEGYEPSLSKKLFTGMVERVVALVSRVEGTYEFEVQPLREYFAARYLYETAPYSPSGGEQSGTKPDRFDAIARNFYWLNVTRFYAGCYSKGELPSLIDRLQELTEVEGYRLISHPRILAATLLSDWVFTQHPKSVQAVVELILDGMGLRYILPSNSRRIGQGNPVILPKNCGKDELIKHCFAILGDTPTKDYALDIIDLVKANASSEEIAKLWFGGVVTQKGSKRTQWLEYGLYLGVLAKLTLADLRTALADDPNDPERLNLLFRARRIDYCEAKEDRFNAAIQAILNRDFMVERRRRVQFCLDLLSHALDTARYAVAFSLPRPVPLFECWERNFWLNGGSLSIRDLDRTNIKNPPVFPEVTKCYDIADTAQMESQRPVIEWATELTPWDNLIEKVRSLWGDQWVCFHLANVSSGIKSKSETCTDFPELFDHSKPLCRRTRYARLRAGTVRWWQTQFDQLRNETDVMFILLILLSWGSSKTLTKLSSRIDDFLKEISDENWNRLYISIEEAVKLTQDSSDRLRLVVFDMNSLPSSLSPRTVTLLSVRAKEQNQEKLYSKYLSQYDGCDLLTLQFCQRIALDLLNSSKTNWDSVREVIQKSYKKGAISERYAFHQFVRQSAQNPLPEKIAQEIAQEPDQYPGFLVAAAEAKCKEIVASNITPVGEIANRDKWFAT